MSGGGDPTRQIVPPPAGSAAPPGWLAPDAGPEAPGWAGLPAPPAVTANPAGPAADELSAIWPRIAAYLFDCALATLLAAGVTVLADPQPRRTSGVYLLTFVAAWALVRVAGPALKGESPGKRMLRIATVDTTGRPIGHGVRAVRELPVWALYWIPFVVAIDAVFAERDGLRGMRDRLTRTSVVQRGAVTGGRVAAVLVLALVVIGTATTNLASWNRSPQRSLASFVSDCVGGGGSVAQCSCQRDHLLPSPKTDERGLPQIGDPCAYITGDDPSAPVALPRRVEPTKPGEPGRFSDAERQSSRAQVIAGCRHAGLERELCTCIHDQASLEVDAHSLIGAMTALAHKRNMDPAVGAVFRRVTVLCGGGRRPTA